MTTKYIYPDGITVATAANDNNPLSDHLIPNRIDQNSWAQRRRPMDMIFHGRSMRLFQASQQRPTIWS